MYAQPKKEGGDDTAISNICEMGFDREAAKAALAKHKGDESAAVNDLLGM